MPHGRPRPCNLYLPMAAAVAMVTALPLVALRPPVIKSAFEAPAPVPTATADPGGWVNFGTGHADYAPEGIPDFDQRFGPWQTVPPLREAWTHDGPVAALNALWWLDSALEPMPRPPPEVSDGFDLLVAYGDWDDHAPLNVAPAVGQLAIASKTNGLRRMFTVGTCLSDLAAGVNEFLDRSNAEERFAAQVWPSPSTQELRDWVATGRPTILLLGFWQHHDMVGWRRIGGHYATLVAVNATTGRLRLSDPFRDQTTPAKSGAVHGDAGRVSHDEWILRPSLRQEAPLSLAGYLNGEDQEGLIANFANLNPQRCEDIDTAWLEGATVEADVDAALVIMRAPPRTPTPLPTPTQPISPTRTMTTTLSATATIPVTSTLTAVATTTLATAMMTPTLEPTATTSPEPSPSASPQSSATAPPPTVTPSPLPPPTATETGVPEPTAPPTASPSSTPLGPADICGRVTGVRGAAAPGVPLALERDQVIERRTVSGPDGGYCFMSVPPASYWLRAAGRGCTPAAVAVEVFGGPVRADLIVDCRSEPVYLPFAVVQRSRTTRR